jgi:adenylate cyclase
MIHKALKNKLAKTLFISFLISFIIALLMSRGFLDTYESKVSDLFYSPTHTLDEIVIVAIDDYSFQELGMYSSWSRDYFAQVIDNLNQSEVIGIDVTFDLETDAENDSKLANSVKNATVVLAMLYGDFSFQDDGELYGQSMLKPNPVLGVEDEDYATGFVNIYTDSDGVTRDFDPRISGIEDHNHFSVVIVERYYNGVQPNVEDSRMLINFFAEPGGYEYISFYDVYNGSVPPSYFEGKIVLIGVTSPLEHDDYIVPISAQAMPGVEIHANLVQSILTQDYLVYQDDVTAAGIVILFGLLAGLLLFKFKMHIATVLIAVIAVAYIFLSIFMYGSGLILNVLFPLITLVIVYIAIVVIYYRTEVRSRKWITSVFGKYVSPVVIENLIKNPDKLNLGGEKRNITIFFSDIRGFTPISEKLKPEELVHLLNEYLTEMTSIILKNEGLVDKYMGDAIMAFWGAPLDQPDHAELACESSLEMMDKLKELKKKWEKEGIPSFDIGIGLNSGDAIVGNMGSSSRFDYTAMGDSVNLASRLENLNKTYGTNIIISENTYKLVKDKYKTRKIDVVKVKGKTKPIAIYELLSKRPKSSKK